MDNAVFKNVAKEIKQKKKVDVGVFNDDKVAGWAIKYAGNNNGFLKDLPEAYEKIMGLGTRCEYILFYVIGNYFPYEIQFS